MATYYVGTGGNNSNNGTSWALRKLTLNGAEDIPVAAGDTVYVGPGVYRELLTIDVSGTSGNPITYIADIDGSHTDGVGGTVRVTGSDNDTTTARSQCITATNRSYRTFRGFAFNITNFECIYAATATYWIVEDCTFDVSGPRTALKFDGVCSNNTVRRCVFQGNRNGVGVEYTHSATVSNSTNAVENCVFTGLQNQIQSIRVGGITIKHCLFYANGAPGWGYYAVGVATALAAGQTMTINNCIFWGCGTALAATVTGEVVENYNAFAGCWTDRSNVSSGANSNTYPMLAAPPTLGNALRYPAALFGTLSEWSPLRALAGTAMASEDMFGITRPATDSKKSWGPIQYVEPRRDTGTKRTGAASLKLPDAGRHQMLVPSTNASTTIACYVYWGANYAGTKPQMVVKQPGVADTTVTATGSSGNWEQLTTTLTPAAAPAYVVVELVSNNTAAQAAGTAVFFDDLVVA